MDEEEEYEFLHDCPSVHDETDPELHGDTADQTINQSEIKICSIYLLPTVLFQYIHEFSGTESYQSLMNADRTHFQIIKYETLKCIISIQHSGNKDDTIQQLQRVEKFFGKVKNPSKQIGLAFFDAKKDVLNQFRPIFPKINEIKVFAEENEVFDNNFDYSMFNNIPKVYLNGFFDVVEITKGLENIQELVIDGFEQLIFIHAPLISRGKLERLQIINCDSLMEVKDLQPVPRMNSNDFKSFSYCCTNATLSCKLLVPETFRSLTKLELCGLFPNYAIDYSFCSNILFITLINRNKHYEPILPVFFGQEIILESFDLMMWNQSNLPNARRVLLTKCTGLTILPLISKVRILELIDLPSLLKIPHLPLSMDSSSRKLSSENESFLQLRALTILGCNHLQDLSRFDGSFIRDVFIHKCLSIDNISYFRNVYRLIIDQCSNIKAFDHFDETQLPLSERNVELFGLTGVINFSHLGNIGTLILDSLADLVSGGGIHNVENLIITQCNSLITTFNLRNISNSLTIIKCPKLERLCNLQSIPNLTLRQLPKVSDLNGIGNHESLVFENVPELETLAYEYAAENEYRKEEKKYQIFHSVKTCQALNGMKLW